VRGPSKMIPWFDAGMTLRDDIDERIREPDQYWTPALAHVIATGRQDLPDTISIQEQVTAQGALIGALRRVILDLADEIERLRSATSFDLDERA
jgi:hypothetical protein